MIIRGRQALAVILAVAACAVGLGVARASKPSASKRWFYILEGVGTAGITIGQSTDRDVISTLGPKYEAVTHNQYSVEIKYAELGLSFYYCLKNKQKKIFDIVVDYGTTSKGITIGESTLKDIYDQYGKEDDTGTCSPQSCVYEYKGVQFLVESQTKIVDEQAVIEPSQMKVVRIDIVAPDKSSNFCDGFDREEKKEP